MGSFGSRALTLYACLLGFTVTFVPSLFGEEFWTRNASGGPLQYIANGDPSQLEVTGWQIWLYKTGASANGERSSERWGMIDGSSIDEVQKALKAAQDDESRYGIQFPGCTYFNPLGPVAVLKSSGGEANSGNRQRYRNLADVFWTWLVSPQVRDVLENAKKGRYGASFHTFKDFVDNLKIIQANVVKAGDTSERFESVTMDKLDALETEITKLETITRTSGQQTTSGTSSWKNWSWRDVDGGQDTQRIRVENDTLFVEFIRNGKVSSVYSVPLTAKMGAYVFNHITGGRSLSSPAGNNYWVTDLSTNRPMRHQSEDGDIQESGVKLELFFPDKQTAEEAAAGLKSMSKSASP